MTDTALRKKIQELTRTASRGLIVIKLMQLMKTSSKIVIQLYSANLKLHETRSLEGPRRASIL